MNTYGSEWGESRLWFWNNLECHWRTIGKKDNPPLLFLHGFGASSKHWRNNAREFSAKGFCVYSLDLIGFGDSEQPSRKKILKLDNYFWARQVIAFLEQVININHNEKTVLIGNSLGGLVILNVSVIRPDLVAASVTAPLPDPAFMQSFFLPEKGLYRKLFECLIYLIYEILPLKFFIFLITNSPLIEIALQSAYKKNIKMDRELLKIVKAPAQRKNASKALRAMCIGMTLRKRNITGPVLLQNLDRNINRPPFMLLWGKDDRLVPLEIGQKLQQNYPWLKLCVIENAGHCPHDESPTKFNRMILNWLKLNLLEHN